MMPKEEVEKRGWHHVSGCGGNIAWHTEDDTYEVADKDVLKKDVELYLEAVVTFANAELLPLHFRSAVREILAAVEGYQQAAGTRFDLSGVTGGLKKLHERLATFYEAAEGGTIPTRAANDTMLALSRALVPLNYALRGPHLQDPAVTLPPVPLLSIAADLDIFDKDTIGFALATLLRGRNAVLATIDRAATAIECASST